MTDLIPRDAAIAAITIGHTVTQHEKALRAIPTIDPASIREAALREAALKEAAGKCAEHAKAARKNLGASETETDASIWSAIVARCDMLNEAILALIGEKK